MESILCAFANKFLEGKDLEKVKEIARELLDILSIEIIAKKTGLSIEKVEKLKEDKQK